MCGIFGAITGKYNQDHLKLYFDKISHRGPDYSELRQIKHDLWLGFHRLAVNGLNDISNQPMHLDDCWLVANAEIFNYKHLAAVYGIQLQTGSDCEIIIHLYRKFGMIKTLDLIDAEFAFILYDESKGEIFAARDHLGVRGMYVGRDADGEVFFASESKALTFCDELDQFPPGHWWSSESAYTFHRYYDHQYPTHDITEEDFICESIRNLFTNAVEKRLMSERPVGCLLSGGLDSSLVAALVAKHWKWSGPLETFSIGLPGSPDLAAARLVAEHIGSKHHHVELSESDFLEAIEDTIYMLGSYDVTTIRASVGHMLISRYVRDNSDVKVLFSGETADEFGSYLYFQNAPSAEIFQTEATRLLKDIQYFDMKRGDRSISYAGIEARVPFADKAFVQFYMGIDPALRMFDSQKIEKYLLRKAFEAEDLLPSEILWRRKNGFSDSVSNVSRSWSTIIKEHIDGLISDAEYENTKHEYQPFPVSKEAYYYRKIFTAFYPGFENLTPYQWLPKWCGDVTDPSARLLELYEAD